MCRHPWLCGLLLLVEAAVATSRIAAAPEKSAPIPESAALRPASERFASADVSEVPSLRRHVLPLMGRLGCNGRACHGSFQGQGGFRLSLFGYDFVKDFEALVKGDAPRVDLGRPLSSLILTKPTSADVDQHGGGKRMDVGSWQYRLIERWIAAGALPVDPVSDARLVKMVVTPTDIVCRQEGQRTPLSAVVYWSDGAVEDVTPLCRFTSNDEAVAKVDADGVVTSVGKGDSHIVVYYDNGIVPVSVLLPVSDQVGPKFPPIAAKTKVDELVLAKLRKLGVMPSGLSNDADFLRRASLDITGQLPAADEVKTFLADASPDKRDRKIDELLHRPAYAAWWTNKLCDILGNNPQQLRDSFTNVSGFDRQWYRWIYRRIAENMPYDKLVEGIVLANGRSSPTQTFEQYCADMGSYFRDDNRADFADRETMPYFWMRRNLRDANQKALAFSYAFLGVRLQCAECHKHPFDQWSQDDFRNFTAFFDRITTGRRDKKAYDELMAKLKDKLPEDKAKRSEKLREMVAHGEALPWGEVYVQPAKDANNDRDRKRGKDKDKDKNIAAGRVITPTLLGGEEVVDQTYDDPRQPLMDWLRQKNNPYFARAFVNRVWGNYFGIGIVEPTDDMNLANAPSNKELLDYLSSAFIEHAYDIRWLMREIVTSDAYQRDWQTNATNAHDVHNFSHAVPRRLPAELVYDAIQFATAGKDEVEARRKNPAELCAVGTALGYSQADGGKNRGSSSYAMTVFGRPKRETPCDCERSNEPTLLQSVFLRNDGEVYKCIDRKNGWLDEASAAIAAASGDDSAAAVRDCVVEAYLRAFGRYPNDTELTQTVDYVTQAQKPRVGLRDLMWALLNSKEFVVNH